MERNNVGFNHSRKGLYRKERICINFRLCKACCVGGENQDVVSGRDLWMFLDMKRKFTDWMPENLAMFAEGQDYVAFDVNVKCGFGV